MKAQILLIPLLYVAQVFGQINIDDPLTGPSLNTTLWSFEANAPGNGTVSFDATRGMVLTLQPGVAARGIGSTCSLAGDFDVQVGINLISWPTQNLYGLRLGAVDLGAGPFGEVGIYREGGGEFYTVAFTSGSVHTATTNNDKISVLRLKRVGSTLSGYFLSGGVWVQVGGSSGIGTTTTGPTHLNLDISSSNPSAGGVTVAYNSFHVNTGTISCPSDLGNLAAGRATTLLNRPYFEGAKGYDYASIPNHYVDPNTISNGYKHCDGSLGCTGFSTLPGIDCSGLVLWSYNTAAGASTNYLMGNPISYDGAGAQCSDQQSMSLNVTSPNDLRPGDLLCFKYHLSKGPSNHVGMYAGGGEVVEAYLQGIGVVSSSLIPDTQGRTRANYDPHGGLPLCTSTMTSSCFDFLGYRRPNAAPRIGIAIITHSPVSLAVTDPDGFTIDAHTGIVTERESLREVPGQLYYVEESNLDDAVIAPKLKPGIYIVKVAPKPNTSLASTYSLTVTAAGHTVVLADKVSVAAIPTNGYGIESTGSGIVPFIPVAIDIKPRRFPNVVNLRKSTIPVAILSSHGFDAPSQINRGSLTFGHTGNEQSLALCRVGGKDVNGDGLPDLVCRFSIRLSEFTAGDTQGVLKGRTVNDVPFVGTDSVRVLKPGEADPDGDSDPDF